MSAKTFLVGLTIAVRTLCRYFIRYQTQIMAAIDASSLSSGDKLTVKAFLTSIQATCLILETLTGY